MLSGVVWPLYACLTSAAVGLCGNWADTGTPFWEAFPAGPAAAALSTQIQPQPAFPSLHKILLLQWGLEGAHRQKSSSLGIAHHPFLPFPSPLFLFPLLRTPFPFCPPFCEILISTPPPPKISHWRLFSVGGGVFYWRSFTHDGLGRGSFTEPRGGRASRQYTARVLPRASIRPYIPPLIAPELRGRELWLCLEHTRLLSWARPQDEDRDPLV